ncbi:MAG: cystathionine gamma-synthase family protein [Bacteroidetes bacterium]|nr:cystathionine gamma-synthase family protein [Bacteroidota bacterium]
MKKSKKNLKPESLMMSFGYDPRLAQGAVKSPIYQTSTFAFKSAEDGKAFFEVAYGLREKRPREKLGMIYSRLNNPDLEILEKRLCLWDEAEEGAVFESGMSAITTVFLEFLKPGDLLLYSGPLYGGTDHFINHVLHKWGIDTLGFRAGLSNEAIVERLEASGKADKLAMIFLETPANPTNALVDMEGIKAIADRYSSKDKEVLVAVDNTYLGPVFQHPLKFGADLVLYSATKYIGGHSDVIAGACLGSSKLISRVKTLRTFLGNMTGPWTGWLLMRSLETLKPRMELQASNARKVATFLQNHPKVEKVYYLGFIPKTDPAFKIYRRQCLSPGAMISFDIQGGEPSAFRFLNHLKLFKLAVSLGSTESLAQHPSTMTHSDVAPEDKKAISITDKLVRLSIGIENADDLIWDIDEALDTV